MTPELLTTLIMLGATIVVGIAVIIFAIVRGDMKNFIIAKMEEAGEKYKDLQKPERSLKKLDYVIDAVKEKYKLGELFLNIKKFIEYVVSINNKEM